MNKKDFPIFKHHPTLIYLDSAATSQKPQAVIDAVSHFYAYSNAPIHRGMYPLAEDATKMYEDVRHKTSLFFGCSRNEVVFTKNATEGINTVTKGWAQEILRKRDEIVLPINEHHANFVPWQGVSEKTGAKICYVRIQDGCLDVGELLNSINKRTRIVAISMASNVTGELLPLAFIISQVKKKNSKVKVVVDAAQTAGKVDVNFKKLGADFLVVSGHKMYAPTGVGVLIVRQNMHARMSPLLTGGHMIRSVTKGKTVFEAAPILFEAGTPIAEAVIGFGAALLYIQKIGMKKIRHHEIKLITYAIKKLAKIDGIHIIGPKESKKKIGVVSFYHEKIHAHDIASILGSEGIAVRAGHHCAMPLHAALGISASIRMSFGIYNDTKDIDRAVAILKKIVQII